LESYRQNQKKSIKGKNGEDLSLGLVDNEPNENEDLEHESSAQYVENNFDSNKKVWNDKSLISQVS